MSLFILVFFFCRVPFLLGKKRRTIILLEVSKVIVCDPPKEVIGIFSDTRLYWILIIQTYNVHRNIEQIEYRPAIRCHRLIFRQCAIIGSFVNLLTF